jgi:hypothetical protein
MGKTPIWVAVFVLASSALAQQSSSYNISDHALNAGGHPDAGVVLTSSSYRITLGAIGDSIVAPVLSSVSYHMDGSFTSRYPPPGEVGGLSFTDEQTLQWLPEPSVGDYNLYRGLISNLSSLGYGQCEQQDLTDETATDSDAVPAGDGYFYLVTAENRLDEEGPKGSDSSGIRRLGTVCP